MLGVVVGVGSIAAAFEVNRWIADPASVEMAVAHRIDAFGVVTGFAGFGLLVATGLAWFMWLHQLASAMDPRVLKRSPGWHIAHYFIPFAWFWLPYQAMSDLGGGIRAGRWHGTVGWPTATLPAPGSILAWWFWFLLHVIADQASTRLALAADDLPTLRASLASDALAGVLSLIAALLAARLVRQIRRVTPRPVPR